MSHPVLFDSINDYAETVDALNHVLAGWKDIYTKEGVPERMAQLYLDTERQYGRTHLLHVCVGIALTLGARLRYERMLPPSDN